MKKTGYASSRTLTPMDEIDILTFFQKISSNYLGGKPACNLPPKLSITKGVLLIPYMRHLIIREIACPDVAPSIYTLLALEHLIICVEEFQHLVLFVLRLTLPKNIEELAITCQSV